MKLPAFLSLGRNEKTILAGVNRHLDVVVQIVDAFRLVVVSVASGDSDSAKAAAEAVFAGETRADQVHRELSLQIADGSFFGGIREDLLALLEKVDNIADSAKDSARLLVFSKLDDDARKFVSSDEMKRFTDEVAVAVEALVALVHAFDGGKKLVLSKIPGVEDAEEEADERKDELLGALAESESAMNPLTVIKLRDFIFMTDNIADNAEDCSDVILTLVTKGYG